VLKAGGADLVLCAVYLHNNAGKLDNIVHPVPEEVDRQIAGLKLIAMGIEIDQLTTEQEAYLCSWEEGT
jgi:adenosylhomocysteinase